MAATLGPIGPSGMQYVGGSSGSSSFGSPKDSPDHLVCCVGCGAVFVLSIVLDQKPPYLSGMDPGVIRQGRTCTSCLQTQGYRIIADVTFRGIVEG